MSEHVCMTKNCSNTGTSKGLTSYILVTLFFLRWHLIHTRGISFWLLIHHFILIKSDLTDPYTTPHHSHSLSPDFFKQRHYSGVTERLRALKYFCKLHKYTVVHSQPRWFYICNIFSWMKTRIHSCQSLEVLLPKANGIKYSLKKKIRRD